MKESNSSPFANWNNPYVTVHFKCRICQKDLPKQAYWKKHFSFHTEAPKHTCDICDKAFKQASDLKRHKKTHEKKFETNVKFEETYY